MELIIATCTITLSLIAIFITYSGNELHGPRKLRSDKTKLYEEYYKYKLITNEQEKELSRQLIKDIFYIITKRHESFSFIDAILKIENKDELLTNLDGSREFYTYEDTQETNLKSESSITIKIKHEEENKLFFTHTSLLLIIAISILWLTLNLLLLLESMPFSRGSDLLEYFENFGGQSKVYYMLISTSVLTMVLVKSLKVLFAANRSLEAIKELIKTYPYTQKTNSLARFLRGALFITIEKPKTLVAFLIVIITYSISEKPYIETVCNQLTQAPQVHTSSKTIN